MVRPALPCGGVPLSAALTYEDAIVSEKADWVVYWTYQRVMERSLSGGRSIIAHHTLPLMRSGRQPAGCDRWGRPWALMDIDQEFVPRDENVWRHPHLPGRVLVAVLVSFDEEPYYFPDAPALLRALHQSAKAEGAVAAQPGAQGWTGRELKQEEALLQPHTYPPCGAVTSCLREWTQFAHRGEGYREGPAMPGGPDQVSFHTGCWDFPEPIVPPIIAGSPKDEPADRKLRIPERTQAGDRKERTLRDKWQATHDMDPPAWADRGFARIKAHMKQQAEAARGADLDTLTVYRSPPEWAPHQQIRASLDPHLPGEQVPVGQSVKYDDGQAIPDHTLPRFRGNPKSNFQVMTPVLEHLRGYWTQEHQSPRWKGDGKGDIRTQEGRLKEIIHGYAYAVSQRVTTYEFKAPDGLNHGLSLLYDEVEKYLVPPMVDHASALLGDFMTLYQEREVNRRRLAQLDQQALEAKDQRDAETTILRAQLAGARKEIEWGHQLRERLEDRLKETKSREEKAQQALQTSRDRSAQLAGEIAAVRKQMGEVENELERIRRITRTRSRSESLTQKRAETASSKTLTSSIAQMTIGTVPPATTTSYSRPAATTLDTSSAVAAGGQFSTQAGLADATLSATQSAAQLATRSLYATPLPPPGFPCLPAGYPPYWGMYPYPYPQYVPPMTTLAMGRALAAVTANSLTPGGEQRPPSASEEPAPDTPEIRPESPQSPGEDQDWPADPYADMPPLEGVEESDEGSEIEIQGTVCAVAPIQKGKGHR